MIGRTLSHYTVLGELSRGGMGIVYRALDTKLNREVALKVLPPELVADPERKRRFIQEAQAAAALQHPRIAVVYQIDDVEGVTFIAMELIRGEKLSKILSEGALPVPRALELAVQITDGLAEAHEKGVIHRDLKPANIMVGDDDQAKIIDFGLAKLVAPLSGTDSDTGTADKDTEPGRIMGTFAYMSPEQARGQKVDPRTDIFTTGTLLYEMLTGGPPFQGASRSATLRAVMQSPAPPLVHLVKGPFAAELQRIVHRCLEKDLHDRYQTARDLLAELRSVKKASDSETTSGRRGRRWPAVWVGLMVLAAAVSYLAIKGRVALPGRPSIRLVNPRQVTFAVGREDFVAWSPDGGRLAYGSTESGNWDIWLTQIGGGQAVNMTGDYPENDNFPNWSPDGRHVAFWSQREGGGYFVMSALGGKPRKLLAGETLLSRPLWSADGTRVACVVRELSGGSVVRMVSLSTLESRSNPLRTPDGFAMESSLSADEDLVTYVDAISETADVTRIWISRLSNGQAFPVTNGMSRDWSPTWAPDGRSLLFVSNRGGAMDLWSQPLSGEGKPEGEARPLTIGVGMRSAVLSRDGKHVAYSRGRKMANLWRVPILADRRATWPEAQQLTMDEAFIEFVDVSPDGTRVAVSSDRSGNQDLWILPVTGGSMEQLTNDHVPEWGPSWSPDGHEIAFYSYRTGRREIYVMAAAGGPARQVTRLEAQAQRPSWSPDGRSLAFASWDGISLQMWTVSAAGGEPRQITEGSTFSINPRWSPDGGSIFFSSNRRDGAWRLWKMPEAGGSVAPVTKGQGWGHLQWSRNEKSVYFQGDGDRQDNLWAVNLDDKTEHPVTDFRGRRGWLDGNGLATDGKYLYFTWQEDTGDVWVMDVVESK